MFGYLPLVRVFVLKFKFAYLHPGTVTIFMGYTHAHMCYVRTACSTYIWYYMLCWFMLLQTRERWRHHCRQRQRPAGGDGKVAGVNGLN